MNIRTRLFGLFSIGILFSIQLHGQTLVWGNQMNVGTSHLLRTNNIYGWAYNSIVGGGYNTNDGHTACTIGGGWANWITDTNEGYSLIAGGSFNRADGRYIVIGGGLRNLALKTNGLPTSPNQNSGNYVTISGGADNVSFSYNTVIAGGVENVIEGYAYNSVISGGYENFIGYHSGYSTISGGTENVIQGGATWAAINGGYENLIQGAIPLGETSTNSGTAHFGWIGGGRLNTILGAGVQGSIGGGAENLLSGGSGVIAGGKRNTNAANWGVISGGKDNLIISNATSATIAGGEANFVDHSSHRAAIAGGYYNMIGTNASHSSIVGGFQNTIFDDSEGATISGGAYNEAAGDYSLAAGYYADAAHDGAFVWSDNSSASSFSSTNNNEFAVRTHGGVRFETGSSTGVKLAPGAGSWASLSDRNAKENFSRINAREVLEEVVNLPINTWNYKAQDESVRHIGPVAQDFHAAFGLGDDDRTITSVDTDGVALAAIQGLNQIIVEKNEIIEKLEERLQRLERILLKSNP